MPWFFSSPETITPQLVTQDEPTTEENSVTETPYTGCAWCGDGDGNGLCSDCEAKHFPRQEGAQ